MSITQKDDGWPSTTGMGERSNIARAGSEATGERSNIARARSEAVGERSNDSRASCKIFWTWDVMSCVTLRWLIAIFLVVMNHSPYEC